VTSRVATHSPTAGPRTYPVVQFTVAGVTEAAHGLGRPYTVVFDGTCKMCSRLSRVLEKWDRHRVMEIVPSQRPGVAARFPWIPRHAYAEALQMIGPGGVTWSGAEAVEQLLTVLPKGKLIAWVFRIPFMRTIADRIYRWVAQNRYKLGCGDHCMSRPPDVMFGEGD
jgi:predicted DCC family thiol-disulfide oxidoreductase YuxK